MSTHDFKLAKRPAPDPLLVEIADYALAWAEAHPELADPSR